MKPIHKYATIWMTLAGTALAYAYIKTLGKDKNLNLLKTLAIGSLAGAGLGLTIDLPSRKKKEVTEESLRKLAESLKKEDSSQLENYLFLLKKANLSEKDNQRVLNVINGILLAKKDNKWDEKSDLISKKKLILSYGVSEDDFNVFQDVIVKNIADLIANVINK